MNYSYDNDAISLVNRVDALFGGITNSDLADYGKFGPTPLAAAMWWTADSQADYGAEGDVVDGSYPFMQDAWNDAMGGFELTDLVNDAKTDEYVKKVEAYDKAYQIGAKFESMLWLACTVVCAWRTLNDGLPLDIWSAESLDKIEKEFKRDREAVANDMKFALGLQTGSTR